MGKKLKDKVVDAIADDLYATPQAGKKYREETDHARNSIDVTPKRSMRTAYRAVTQFNDPDTAATLLGTDDSEGAKSQGKYMIETLRKRRQAEFKERHKK